MIDNSVLSQIHRGRGYFLYTRNSRRFYDCWLADGAAILGHKPPRVLHAMKNAAEKGLWGSFRYNSQFVRVAKMCEALFPDWYLAQVISLPKTYCICAGSEESLLTAVHAVKKDISSTNATTHFFFSTPDGIDTDKKYLCVFAPFNWENRYVLVCTRVKYSWVEHDLSAVEIAGITESLKRASVEQKQYLPQGQLDKLVIPKEIWDQNGHYIRFLGRVEQYIVLYDMFSKHNIIFSPYTFCAVLPLHVSDNMISLWNKATNMYMASDYAAA